MRPFLARLTLVCLFLTAATGAGAYIWEAVGMESVPTWVSDGGVFVDLASDGIFTYTCGISLSHDTGFTWFDADGGLPAGLVHEVETYTPGGDVIILSAIAATEAGFYVGYEPFQDWESGNLPGPGHRSAGGLRPGRPDPLVQAVS